VLNFNETVIQKLNCPLFKARPWLRQLVASFSPLWSGIEPMSGRVEVVVDKTALGQIFSEYFGFPCQYSTDCSTFIIITIHHPVPVQ
jgi:hypothetical protein